MWCPHGPGWHPEEAWILGGDGGEEVRRRSGKQRKQDLRVPSGVRAREGHALVAEGAREVEPLWKWDVRHDDGYVRPKARWVCLQAG